MVAYHELYALYSLSCLTIMFSHISATTLNIIIIVVIITYLICLNRQQYNTLLRL